MKLLTPFLVLTSVLLFSFQAEAMPAMPYQLSYSCSAGRNAGQAAAPLSGKVPFVLLADGSISAETPMLFISNYYVNAWVVRSASTTQVGQLVVDPNYEGLGATSRYSISEAIQPGKLFSITSTGFKDSTLLFGLCNLSIVGNVAPIATPVPIAPARIAPAL